MKWTVKDSLETGEINMKVWWIEDEPDLREFIEFVLENLEETKAPFDWEVVSHWNECGQKAGDLVLHDKLGVGEEKIIPGVEYIPCTGSVILDETTRGTILNKPFEIEEVHRVISERVYFEDL